MSCCIALRRGGAEQEPSSNAPVFLTRPVLCDYARNTDEGDLFQVWVWSRTIDHNGSSAGQAWAVYLTEWRGKDDTFPLSIATIRP